MLLAGRNISAKWVRLVSLVVCFAIILSSLPVHFRRDSAYAQGSGGLKRQLPPFYKLPNIDTMITEGKKAKQTESPRPALKPATACGYRDQPCKRKKEKEKKVGMNFGPSNDNAERATNVAATDAAKKSSGSWFDRLRSAFSNALSGFTSVSAKSNSFSDSDLDRNGENSAPAAFNNIAAGAVTAQTGLLDAKLDPRYRIGGSGEDMFSGNYNFSLPLVSLPGRGGLDLNLTLSYNSLLWVKHGGVIEFEPEYYQSLTAGFRTGVPQIDGPYYVHNSNTYIVYLPSGKRVEMRQSGNNRFEAIDSSYLYLVVNNSNPFQMTLYATDGTQYIFEQFRCTQIKDINGNYISIAYKYIGDSEYPAEVIDKVTDTLGREIVFNYDDQPGGTLHLMSITQNRGGQTYYWAQFDYSTKLVAPNFGSLPVYGPNNTNIPVLARVITADKARHTFVYNSWGQVDGIGTYGEADNQRAVTSYAFPSTGSAQSDCPRFSQRNDGIFAWPGDPAYYNQTTGFGYAITYFYFDPSESFSQMNTPDAVEHKEFFHTSGNMRGLTMRTESKKGSDRQFTDYTWLSDSAASPPLRPRLTEIQVCDDRNNNGTYDSGTDKLRVTTISYANFASTIRLPEFVREFNEGAAGVYRSTKTEYLAGAYISNALSTNAARRIIGLPRFTYLYEGDAEFGPATLVAKTENIYDSPDEAGTTFLQAHSSAPLQHDASLGAGFRGNLTKTRRYSVVNGVAGSYIESKTGYYTTGNVALTKIARDAQTNIETDIYYDDSFSTGAPPPGQATYAYPTKVKDPDNYYSAVKFNYYFGGVTETVDPKNYVINPNNPPVKTVRTYDSLGRPEKMAVWKDGAEYSHVRYTYSVDHNSVGTWTTVNNLAEETFVFYMLDGVSRDRLVISEHPGSQGGLRSSYRVYDKMGRIAEWSRSTEIDGNLVPAGDDPSYIAGFQTFDWKGRPKTTTNFDGTSSTINYTGCGCAGGDITEFIDEVGRKRKVYSDVFGRALKSESLNSDGTVYSTQTSAYNIRDQITQVDQIVGTSGTSYIATRDYDGYGRLWKKKMPIESSDTVYEYNDDGTVRTITDGRQAAATFTYYGRSLVQDITHTVPAGIAATPNVHYNYDANGNRTLMNDGVGSVTYAYNSLSRMESEVRQFSGLPGSHSLTYDYNLVGQMKRISFESGAYPNENNSVYYDYNKVGEMILVTGSPIADVTQYQSQMKYRAWGSLKSASYGNGLTLSAGYTARQQLQDFEIAKAGSPIMMKSQYSYYNDGRIKYAKDLDYDKFDRAYSYDHVGRLQDAYTGTEARDFINQTTTTPVTAPYRETYQYDVWDNMTSSNGRFWIDGEYDFSAIYNNGRRQGFAYDESGHLTSDGANAYTYDAVGRNISATGQSQSTQAFDGDGAVVKQTPNGVPIYYLRSTVMGKQVIVEIAGSAGSGGFPLGAKKTGHVYAGSAEIAYHKFPNYGSQPNVYWSHLNPVTGSFGTSIANGQYMAETEPDPRGGHVGLTDWVIQPPSPLSRNTTVLPASYSQHNNDAEVVLDGQVIPWSLAERLIGGESAVVAPSETTRYNHTTGQYEFFRAYGNGTQGWASFNYIPGGSATGGGLKIYENNPDNSTGALLDATGEGADNYFDTDQDDDGYTFSFERYPGARDLKGEAVKAIDKFLAENKRCELLLGRLLRLVAKRTNYIDPSGDEGLLNKSLYDLGHRSTATEESDRKTSLGKEAGPYNYAVTINYTVYLGHLVTKNSGGSHKSPNNRITYTHETFHPAFPGGPNDRHISHVGIAVHFNLRSQAEFDKLSNSGKNIDSIASEDLDAFLKQGCPKNFKAKFTYNTKGR